MAALEVVAAYNTELEAAVVVRRLEAAGIPAMVRGDNLAGAFPLMQMSTGGYQVLVNAARLPQARRHIARPGRSALDQRPSQPPSPPDETARAVRIAYVIAVLIGMLLLGLGGARVLFVGDLIRF